MITLSIFTLQGFPIAGTEIGDECFCGSSNDFINLKQKSEKCTVPCEADKSQPCGGVWSITVFASGNIHSQY